MTVHVRAGIDNSPVTATRCADYGIDTVRAALRDLVAPLGGMAAFVKPGERIALKPNILMGASPQKAIATHPVVVGAVAAAVREAGAHPVVVESPGTGVAHARLPIERAFRKAGYVEAARRFGFELSLDTDWQMVSNPEGRLAKRLEVINPVLRADGVINLAKLKTHTFMIFTGATKNLFGVIPGLNKSAYHARLEDPRRFADMLLDVAYFVRPRLSIVDGILGMEGNGPGTAGTPRRLGLLVAGADPVAVDVACCRIVGLRTSAVPVLAAARERGLWSGREGDIETLGTPIAAVRLDDFAAPDGYSGMGLGYGGRFDVVLQPLLRRFNRMPRPKASRCTLCAVCAGSCPTGAISVDKEGGAIKVDDRLCIRCYCCHEVCPSAAIDLEFSATGRVLHRLNLV